VPCSPSSLPPLQNEYVYITDDDIWNTYENTRTFLTQYYYGKNYKGVITRTDGFCKIINKSKIIGVLTNANQFIKILPSIQNVNDGVDAIINDDSIAADNEIEVSDNVDTERVEYMTHLKLETNFFNVFRNTIRILINDYANAKIQREIRDDINKPYLFYNDKLKKVIDNLKLLTESDGQNSKIIFNADFNAESNKELLTNVTACMSNSIDTCDNQLCKLSNDNCAIILPKLNLITNNDNEIYYYSKMADELIRYNRINSFIFNSNAYLSFEPHGFNLSTNEIILVQSLLKSYLADLIPVVLNNKYVTNNAYDTAKPVASLFYNDTFNVDINQTFEGEGDVVFIKRKNKKEQILPKTKKIVGPVKKQTKKVKLVIEEDI